MNTLVIALIGVSACMHAGWNVLARFQREEYAFFRKMLIVSVAAGFVPFTISEYLARSLTGTAWVCVAISGACCGFYYFFLARAYQSSDFTIAYPVARSLPVLLIGAGDVIRGLFPSMLSWAGMCLVVTGCFLVPLKSLRDVSFSRYFNRSSLWMVLTGIGTVGYTLSDKIASETVQQGPAAAARYGYFFF
ncbi:hypothetical protein ACFL47_03270 [Candidatus Latescibacterota bacterium]